MKNQSEYEERRAQAHYRLIALIFLPRSRSVSHSLLIQVLFSNRQLKNQSEYEERRAQAHYRLIALIFLPRSRSVSHSLLIQVLFSNRQLKNQSEYEERRAQAHYRLIALIFLPRSHTVSRSIVKYLGIVFESKINEKSERVRRAKTLKTSQAHYRKKIRASTKSKSEEYADFLPRSHTVSRSFLIQVLFSNHR
jgi:hypothetical protein